jgi:hypothetical protein
MYMRSRVQDKIKAITLRMEGYSYKEIIEQVPVSKGLLSSWLKYIRLNPDQEKALLDKIKERSNEGRARAVETNRAKRLEREGLAVNEAKKLYIQFSTDPMFIAGISLYWAEGSKRTGSFQFMNSDPEMIKFMVFWMQKYLGVKKEDIFLRLNTHADFKEENYEVFWSEYTGIPLGQFKKTTYKPNEKHGKYKKNPTYKGCIRIEIKGGLALLRKVIALYKILNSEAEMLYSER